jgi:transcription-repair coupling factor (superfamily II helicase)
MEFDSLLGALEAPSAAAPHCTWAELHGGALSLAAAEAAGRHAGPVCVVTASAAEADRLERELAFFGRRAARRIPDYETVPHEPISPPQD